MSDLNGIGAQAIVVDVFDDESLQRAVMAFRPDTVIHQLTDLSGGIDPVRNARFRRMGTANLIRSALAARARRVIAQSIVWAYAPGVEPHQETDLLDVEAPEPRRTSVRGVMELEQMVLGTPSLQGIVLRYGQLYGPGTGVTHPTGSAPVQVEDAAWAALLAISSSRTGPFNICGTE